MRAIVSFDVSDFSLDEAELRRRGFGERPEFWRLRRRRRPGSLAGMAATTKSRSCIRCNHF